MPPITILAEKQRLWPVVIHQATSSKIVIIPKYLFGGLCSFPTLQRHFSQIKKMEMCSFSSQYDNNLISGNDPHQRFIRHSNGQLDAQVSCWVGISKAPHLIKLISLLATGPVS